MIGLPKTISIDRKKLCQISSGTQGTEGAVLLMLFYSLGNQNYIILEYNHNYNKILKSDWLSTALISALIGQFNRTVRVMPK